MGLSAREAQGSIRLSLGEYSTNENIDFTAQTLVAAVEKLRAVSSIA
jgi:cysteine sulfinate desulfinase/cysteine desulfurase-like protein